MFLENGIAIKQIHIDFSKVTDMVLFGSQCDYVGKSEGINQLKSKNNVCTYQLMLRL